MKEASAGACCQIASRRQRGVFLLAGRNDLQRAVRKRALQRLGLVARGAHPDVVLFRRRQDHRHRLRMDAGDLGVRFAGEKAADVGCDLAFFGFPDTCPAGPETGESKQRTALIRSEPDRHLLAVDGVVFGERGERDQAAVLRRQLALPVRAVDVADVGGADVRLHPEQPLEIDWLALASSLWAPFFVASISAPCELGMPHRAVTISRPSGELRTSGAG